MSFAQGIFLKFTNITCESKDINTSSVEYCYIRQMDHQKNYFSLRYNLLKPITNNVSFHFQLMIRSNGWKPFMYGIDLEMCRFWKSRYNAFGKLLFTLVDGHTNLNHTCPYMNEKYLAIDKILNTDISKKLPTMPIGKGHYAVYSSWSWNNMSHVETKIYLELS
ncbi:uncharacterized protein LOC6560604 [Drosophila grimshawi]|uniref:uncharacterized protein LOC6560604 n=1 Tax=Drosophila grimshawi TaxID=7222 RepID=UPI0013EEEA8C|nr:uncharacterized protein LOC6560604 [Drosophila grimshawi]